MELDDIETRLFRGSGDFVGRVRAEDSGSLHFGAGRIQDESRLRWSYTPRSVGKYNAHVRGAYLGGEGRIQRAGHAAELNFCEHPLSA